MLYYNTTVVTDRNTIAMESLNTTSVYIGKGGFIGSVVTYAINGYSSNLSIYVAGEVVGQLGGIALGNAEMSAENNHVRVFESGSIFSVYEAITVDGVSSLVDNSGRIECERYSAIVFRSSGGDSVSRVVNTGQIIAGDVGAGIYYQGAEDGKLVNSGRISGGSASFHSLNSTGDMTVINKGTMINDIIFGAGKDTYDGRSGKLVDGEIHGGGGNDKFIGGKSAETYVFVTGDDKDVIYGFAGKGSAHDVLDFSAWASNDTFAEVKSHSSQHSDDLWITGSSGDRVILDHLRFSDLSKSDFIF